MAAVRLAPVADVAAVDPQVCVSSRARSNQAATAENKPTERAHPNEWYCLRCRKICSRTAHETARARATYAYALTPRRDADSTGDAQQYGQRYGDEGLRSCAHRLRSGDFRPLCIQMCPMVAVCRTVRHIRSRGLKRDPYGQYTCHWWSCRTCGSACRWLCRRHR